MPPVGKAKIVIEQQLPLPVLEHPEKQRVILYPEPFIKLELFKQFRLEGYTEPRNPVAHYQVIVDTAKERTRMPMPEQSQFPARFVHNVPIAIHTSHLG